MKLTKEIRKQIADDIRKQKNGINAYLENIITEIENPTGSFEPEEFEYLVIPDWRKKGELVKINIENCRTNIIRIEFLIKAWKSIARA